MLNVFILEKMFRENFITLIKTALFLFFLSFINSSDVEAVQSTVKNGTWWVYLIYICIIAFLIFIIIKLRINRLKTKLEKDLLLKSNERLQEVNEYKSQLLKIAAHDLKNPLNSIMAIAEILIITGKAKDVKEKAESIYHTSVRMLNIIRSFLDSEAIEQNKITLNKKNSDVKNVLESVINLNREYASKKRLRIEFSFHSENDFLAEIDPDRIAQVFENLLSNAIKFSPVGKTIWVNLIRHNQVIQFSVQDEGPGLNEEDKSKMFKKFQKLSTTAIGQELSTGLGLWIVKQLINLHQGEVSISSEPGKGCKFIINLKLK